MNLLVLMALQNGEVLPEEVQVILKQNPNLFLAENNRIKCILTGHEIPCKKAALQQHINGKKYKRVTKDLEKNFQYSGYEPMIMPSTKKGHLNQLFCTLTLRHINKTPSHILRHVQGKKYLKAKERWDQCQKDGTKFIPTPCLNNKAPKNSDTYDEPSKEDSDTDSLSDLYPVEYFEKMNLSGSNDTVESVTDNNSNKDNARKRQTPLEVGLIPKKKKKFSKPKTKEERKRKRMKLLVYP